MYIFLLDFRSVPLLPTGWECYESAHRAPSAPWCMTIVHHQYGNVHLVHNAARLLCTTNMAPCTRCTMVHDHCAPPLWHCAPGAQCYTTIVHHQYGTVHPVHNGARPLCTTNMAPCTGCTLPYWWCTMVMHHGAPWSCTMVHRVHSAVLVVHNGRAPLCTECTVPYWSKSSAHFLGTSSGQPHFIPSRAPKGRCWSGVVRAAESGSAVRPGA